MRIIHTRDFTDKQPCFLLSFRH